MQYLSKPYDAAELDRLAVNDSAIVAGLRSHLRRDIREAGGEPSSTVAAMSRAELLAALQNELLPLPAARPAATVRAGGDAASALADAIRAAMESVTPAAQPLDEDAVRRIAADEAAKVAPRRVVVEVRTEKHVRTVENQHWLFPIACAVVSSGVPLYLCGPAGGGKSTIAHAIADALALPFEFQSFGPGMSEAKLLGYRDAAGCFHDTSLVRLYRDGGVWLADEMDRADGAILTTFNTPLANGSMSTPAGIIPRNADFRCIAGANTAGTGASNLYTAAMELDASTLDRFFFLAFPYDEAMEARAAGVAGPAQKDCRLDAGGVASAERWHAGVLSARAKCEALSMRHTVSPRASIMGAKLCRAGLGLDWLIPGLITRGLPEDEARILELAFREGAL
jgi:cobaltochelatase CobS